MPPTNTYIPNQHEPHPAFCCAVLQDSKGRYILELRPLHETDAAGLITCFGGGIEPTEDPELGLRRELIEELGYTATTLTRVLTLHTRLGPAWFYVGPGPEEGTAQALEPGYTALWLSDEQLIQAEADGKLSSWHRVAIDAIRRGDREAIAPEY